MLGGSGANRDHRARHTSRLRALFRPQGGLNRPLNAAPPEPDGINVHTSSSFQDQVDAVEACIDDGVFPGGAARTIAIALWASSHGLVSLQLAKPDFDWPALGALSHLTLYAHGLGIDAAVRTETPPPHGNHSDRATDP